MLNVAASDKAAISLEKRRLRDEARVDRFLNAKTRTIGIDTDALDHQVEEKLQRKLKEKEEAKQQSNAVHKMCELLDLQEKMCQESKKAVTDDMKAQWKLSLKHDQPVVNEEIESPSAGSMLSLAGEDPYKSDRVRMQQQQMRQWIDSQTGHKVEQTQLDRLESNRLRNYLENITETRGRLDQEDDVLKKTLELEIQDFNMKFAETKKLEAKLQRDERTRLEREEIQAQCGSSMLCEDTSVAAAVGTSVIVDVTQPRRVKYRRDMFRGYSDAQRKSLLKDNENIVADKLNEQEAERQSSQSWADYQRHVCAVLEKQAAIDMLAQQQMKKASNDGIGLQAVLSATRRGEAKKEFMGEITEDGGRGLFEHFGKSCR